MGNKVSLIIPMYNLAEYCTNCLESVLSQTYKDIEVIIIDDGSTDTTLEICRHFAKKDNRIYLYSQKNRGVSAARNRGLEKATGRYISFIDGDDIVSPNYVESLLKLMNEDVCVAVADHVRIFDYEQKIFEEKERSFVKLDAETALERLLRGHFPVSVCGALFDRNCIQDIHFPRNIRHNEDKYFLFETLLKNNDKSVVRTTEKLYGYYVRRTSATQTAWNGSIDIVKVADQIYREIKDANPKHSELAYRAAISARMQIIKEIVRASDARNEHESLYKRYKHQILRAGYPTDSSMRTKAEYIALRSGDLIFKQLVHLYYRIYTENMRFRVNERRIQVD